jgi:hypothetical protein
MGALEEDIYWIYLTPYKKEIIGQREKVLFGPTTLHGDVVKIKCKQMRIINYRDYFDKIMEEIYNKIVKNKFID